MKNYIRAIDSLRKNSPYTAYSERYEDIIWQDKRTSIPTKKECEEELTRLEDADKKLQYQRDRQYPPQNEQLDMIYWDKKNGTKTWEEAIDKVKADHPKPE